MEEVPRDRRQETAEKLQRALVKAKFLGAWEAFMARFRWLRRYTSLSFDCF